MATLDELITRVHATPGYEAAAVELKHANPNCLAKILNDSSFAYDPQLSLDFVEMFSGFTTRDAFDTAIDRLVAEVAKAPLTRLNMDMSRHQAFNDAMYRYAALKVAP